MKIPLNMSNIDDLAEAVNRYGGDASRLNIDYDYLDLGDKFPLDPTMDPFSEEYVQYQIAIYRAISNRDLDQSINEHTPFDYRTHFRSANPYASRDVANVARHVATITSTIISAELPPAARILDMGCGWGLSTEILSFLGASVTSIDINQDFVNLVNDRAERFGSDARAIQSGFDEVADKLREGDKFNAAFFYECMHHAVRPWRVIEQVEQLLAPNGKLMLAGEPIQSIWWPAWGIRLDPLSVYCIRQFGWFESGWSQDFLAEMAQRAGFSCQFVGGSAIGPDPIFIGTKVGKADQFEFSCLDPVEGWNISDSGWTSTGLSTMRVLNFEKGDILELQIWNHRPQNIRAIFHIGAENHHVDLLPGPNNVSLKATETISISSETWCPAEEIKNDDRRLISFTMSKADIVSRNSDLDK